jgi:hypothetical protein
MGRWGNRYQKIIAGLEEVDPELASSVQASDAVTRLMAILPQRYPPGQASGGAGLDAWDYSGLALYEAGRIHEALTIHWSQYQHLLKAKQDRRAFIRVRRWFGSAIALSCSDSPFTRSVT